jgi:hypothetical protein
MSINAIVTTTEFINASVGVPAAVTVPSVGIQGESATQTGMDGIRDVDMAGKTNGSVLVYKTITNKWTATTTLDAQNMEGGEF